MKISQVKTAIKVAEITKGWNIKYSNIDKNILTDNSGRVYLITSNGIIKKIGGSTCKNGIKGTLSPYKSSMKGNPSIRSYGIHILIEKEIEMGNNVEVYMITSKVVLASVKGLFTESTIEIAAFKEMEDKCREDFKSIEGKYPEWNFQENAEKWPEFIREKYEYIKR